MLRTSGATVALLVAATLAGIVGLAVGELVPDRLVAEQLHDARVDRSLSPTRQEPTRLGGRADHFTECIAVAVGLGEPAGTPLLDTIARGTHLGPCERLIAALDSFEETGRLAEGSSYLRYWHGTATVFRPTIALFGLPALRLLCFLSLLLASAVLWRQVADTAGPTAATGLLAPLVVTTDYLELAHVAHHGAALAVALGAAAGALAVTRRDPGATRVWLSAVAAGAAFVYVDLLTNVPGAWLLPPVVVMAAARARSLPPIRVFATGFLAGLGWLVGYAGMWFGKWAFAAVVLGRQEVYDDVRASIDERIDGESVWSENRFGAAIERNVEYWLDRPVAGLLLALAAVAVVGGGRRVFRRHGWAGLSSAAIAALPALLPFVWFEIASNHSQIHAWFTYRSLPLALGAVLLAALQREPVDGGDKLVAYE